MNRAERRRQARERRADRVEAEAWARQYAEASGGRAVQVDGRWCVVGRMDGLSLAEVAETVRAMRRECDECDG